MAARKKRNEGRYNNIPKELLDAIIEGKDPANFTGKDGLLSQLTGALISRMMEAELTEHLDYEPGETPPSEQGNRRNGVRKKGLKSERGEVEIEVPRDRDGTYEPKLVPKHERHFDGFDDKILSMYALGMSVRDIKKHLEEMYSVEVSKDLISRVTDAVIDELNTWRSSELEAVYPIVIIDALMVKMRESGSVKKKAVHLAIGINVDGERSVLGMWTAENEGAKHWAQVMTGLQMRGVEDILILCADGLTGLPDAVESVFPKTVFQTCVVHLIRNSVGLVPWVDRKEVCAGLREVYTAVDVEDARRKLEAFSEEWSEYPLVAKKWWDRFDEWTPFLAFPSDVRRIIYTTNAIEALNRQVRKVIKTRGAFPTTTAAEKLIYLAVKGAQKTWSKRVHNWKRVYMTLAIHFEGRLPL